MIVHEINPILNVSSLAESFDWFEKLGWKKDWDWGDPPSFGSVSAGVCRVFLSQGGQGGRGKGNNAMTFGAGGDETADKGVWMSVWVDDVEAEYRNCLERGLDITSVPANYPWGVREMHVRHPDGHVFRIGQGLNEE